MVTDRRNEKCPIVTDFWQAVTYTFAEMGVNFAAEMKPNAI